MEIRVRGIGKKVGDLQVLTEVNLQLEAASITAVLGPSGCGKTTLLNILAGLILPDSGSVSGADETRVSYLFQEPRLLPWKTVRENCLYVLPKNDGTGRIELVDELLSMTGLTGFADYYPDELSGGMKQRAAIVRAFAYPGEIFLLDEPFKGLDVRLKESLISSFLTVWERTKPVTLLVTHDIDEAVLLGDKVAVFSSRPGTVVTYEENPLKRGYRHMDNKELMEFETKLYKQLLQ
ncbi:MAG: ABC transporter ATP-binding protein [Spirochaetia bacterium]